MPPVTVGAHVGRNLSDEFEGSVVDESVARRERQVWERHEVSVAPHDIEVPMGSPRANQHVGEVSASDWSCFGKARERQRGVVRPGDASDCRGEECLLHTSD